MAVRAGFEPTTTELFKNIGIAPILQCMRATATLILAKSVVLPITLRDYVKGKLPF